MIHLEAKPQTAPVFYERCPVHAQLVLFDGDRRMLGLCDACIREAAEGLSRLEKMPPPRRLRNG